MGLINTLYLFFIVSLLSACSGSKGITKQFNREGQQICVTLNTEIPSKFKLKSRLYHENKVGEAIYSLDDTFCDLLIKKQGKIKLDGEYTLNVGHEFMHCLYGDYHD